MCNGIALVGPQRDFRVHAEKLDVAAVVLTGADAVELFKDRERLESLVALYNENVNYIRPREYDGIHIQFFVMNPEIVLCPHQRNAIAHILYGHNTLLAHTVGAGKTLSLIHIFSMLGSIPFAKLERRVRLPSTSAPS